MYGTLWDDWHFFLGEWIGEGGGQPGQGQGEFTLYPDLQGAILVRKSATSYPASASQPAFTHEDKIIVYHESEAVTQAIYFDNEGHVIHYTVEIAPDRNTVIFLSKVSPSSPRFRLTYAKTSDTTMTIRFEIAPPGKPETFSTYTLGTACLKTFFNTA